MLILPDVREVSGGMVWNLGRPAVLPAQREESVQKRLTRKGAWAGGARDAVPVICWVYMQSSAESSRCSFLCVILGGGTAGQWARGTASVERN